MFSFISAFWWCLLPIFPSTCNFPFPHAFWFFLDLVVQLLPLSYSNLHYEHDSFFFSKFYSYILDVYSFCLYQSLQFYFFFFANSLMSSMFIQWLIFYNSVNLYTIVHFLSIYLCRIIAITNGDSTSRWKMSLRIFTSAKIFLPAINSTF